MLVTLKEVLEIAEKTNSAIGAFNSPTLESARAAVEAAEEMGTPIILSHAEVHNEIVPLEIMGPILVQLAKSATVPIAVHLDHGMSLEMVKKAIDLGFTSVMIDASHYPLDQNVRIVKEVVDYAHQHGVSVEAELGMMTSSGIGGEETEADHIDLDESEMYTDPTVCHTFVGETGIDALAASFGTVHGLYTVEPNLDYERLQEIYTQAQIPIVMHGGSGLADEEYRQTIDKGVRKINYYSYVAKAGAEAVRDYVSQNDPIFYHDLTIIARNALKKEIKRAIQLFNNKKEEHLDANV